MGRSPASARATSRVVSTARASPSARPTSAATASASALDPSALRPRATTPARSSSESGSRRHRVDRESSGALTWKNGFSVVAPMSTSSPSSTEGSRASCWDRLNRWTSSRKRMVPLPCSPSSRRASSTTSRTSLTPAVTADSGTKRLAVAVATTEARVVLPVPGGPHRMAEVSRSDSIRARSGAPGPTRWRCPMISSRVRGRIRAASGALDERRSAAAPENRSSPAIGRLSSALGATADQGRGVQRG